MDEPFEEDPHEEMLLIVLVSDTYFESGRKREVETLLLPYGEIYRDPGDSADSQVIAFRPRSVDLSDKLLADYHSGKLGGIEDVSKNMPFVFD